MCLNLCTFLGVFRFAKMPVGRTRAVSPRGEAATVKPAQSQPARHAAGTRLRGRDDLKAVRKNPGGIAQPIGGRDATR